MYHAKPIVSHRKAESALYQTVQVVFSKVVNDSRAEREEAVGRQDERTPLLPFIPITS